MRIGWAIAAVGVVMVAAVTIAVAMAPADKVFGAREKLCLETCYPYDGKPYEAGKCTCYLDRYQDDEQ